MSDQIELSQRGLPEWPQMYVTGKPVTLEQAKEIIRRTDTFFDWGGGNNHEYNRWVKETLGIPPDPWFGYGYDQESLDQRDRWEKLSPEERQKERDAYAEKRAAWEGRWNCVRTSYVHNNWISCSFIGGPHGWCHPDGNIGFVDNVGKWPSVTEIYEDWKTLVEAFPFLDVAVTLFSGESCEENAEPVVTLLVKDGQVTLAEPNDVHHDNHPKATRRDDSVDSATDEFIGSWGNPRREQGIPDEWIREWAARTAP